LPNGDIKHGSFAAAASLNMYPVQQDSFQMFDAFLKMLRSKITTDGLN
jgi:hypothetical protein